MGTVAKKTLYCFLGCPHRHTPIWPHRMLICSQASADMRYKKARQFIRAPVKRLLSLVSVTVQEDCKGAPCFNYHDAANADGVHIHGAPATTPLHSYPKGIQLPCRTTELAVKNNVIDART